MLPINVVSSVPPKQNGINHENRSWEEINFDKSNRVCSKLQNPAVFEIYIKKNSYMYLDNNQKDELKKLIS